MARKLELTWDKSKKRWKKYYKGRQYYFSFGENKADAEGYQLALETWRKRKLELDTDRQRNKPRRGEYERAIKTRQELALWCRQNGDGEQARIFQMEGEKLLDRFNRLDEPPPLAQDESDPLSSVVNRILHEAGFFSKPETEEEKERLRSFKEAYTYPHWSFPGVVEARAIWEDRLRHIAVVEPDKTVGAAVASFLKRKEAKAKAGEMTTGYYAVLNAHLGRFRDWLGTVYPLESIGAKTLLDFHTALLDLVDKGDMARKYAHDNMVTVRSFVRWCWTLELCGLPRNIDSQDLSFNVTSKKIITFTTDEIKTLVSEASERTRLFLILALNTGMTQQDISVLKHSEVDWKLGKITRKRSKTKDYKSVPTVSYRLWRQTFKLLKKHRSRHPELVLVNSNGLPLKRETLEGGKYKKIDNISGAYRRVADKLAIQKPFKLIRKTGASKLEEHEVYRGFVQLYLGHAPRTIAERHYAAPSSELFDDAVKWLGKQFGL